jgi:hypothetical protein
MPWGDKSKYTGKQDRKAEHIEQSYESRGVPEKEAERRAWATVNKDDGGGKKASGSGRRKIDWPSRRAQGRPDWWRCGSRAIAGEPIGAAKKAAATRKQNAAHAAN